MYADTKYEFLFGIYTEKHECLLLNKGNNIINYVFRGVKCHKTLHIKVIILSLASTITGLKLIKESAGTML